jgi:hypothetical protein
MWLVTHPSALGGLSAQVLVEVLDLGLVDVVQLRPHVGARVGDVLGQQLLGDDLRVGVRVRLILLRLL